VTAVPDPTDRHDDASDGLLFIVPDDARALDADREAYLRELADQAPPTLSDRVALPSVSPQPRLTPRPPVPPTTHRAPWLPRLARTRRWEAYGLSGPLVTAVLLVVALVGSLMTILAPRNAPAPAARPLATTSLQPAGSVGGLLPDVTLDVGPVQVLARSMRPTVLMLVPAACTDCTNVVRAVLNATRTHRLQLVLVGPVQQHDQLVALDHAGAGGQATLAFDPSGRLAASYGNRTPTVVVVAADGVVTAVDPGVTSSVELDPDLFNALRAV
jgi:hypothetical protein